MSVAEEAVRQAREAVQRALSVIDSFRPKIVYKGNLTDILAGQGIGVRPAELLKRRLGVGLVGGRVASPPPPPEPAPVAGEEAEASGLIVVKKEQGKTFIY